jgi:hypothetical protein
VIDGDELDTWYNAAREALQIAKRLGPGLRHVGQALVGAPPDDDEPWPPAPVRELIERVRDPDLEQGVFLGLVNKRGATTRGLEDGGAQELELAAKYRADAELYAAEWPRTAAILRDVARSYENAARRNEDEAEGRRQGLD